VTVETRTFITADEIIGISIQCSNCHVTSRVQLSESSAKGVSERTVCPHCEKRWFVSGSDPRFLAVTGFVQSLIAVRNRVSELESTGVPMTLLLEVKTSTLARASREGD
jgi:hypothetical protein